MNKPIITRAIETIKNSTCMGCSTCRNVCPVDAISMEMDERGYYKPTINKEKCINCGKCDRTCPILNEQKQTDKKELYALWANDDVRMKSSSGGAFTLFAEEILNQGGVVFGAAWGENFKVFHKFITKVEELDELRKSKYVQSFIGDTYRQVKEQLINGKKVLFVGTPCQIGGLKKYIEGEKVEDKNLFLVDVWCYNIPSYKLLKKYLNDNFGNNLEEFEFRYNNGKVYTSNMFKYKIKNQEPKIVTATSYWFKAYFPRMYEPFACTQCKFQGEHRFGDISMGDFWGIEDYDKSWNDGLGTSMVQINTQKGQQFLDEIKQDCKRLEKVPLDWIRAGQGNGKAAHPNQQLFFDYIEQGIHFNKAVDMAMAGKKYDIGFACVQTYRNFGSALTNYALYKTLRDYKKDVLIITQPLSSIISPNTRHFFKKYPFHIYDQAKIYKDKEEMKGLNKICNKFLVGSDQLFNANIYQYIDGFVKLDWVDDNHDKVCYATSFGPNKIYGSLEEKKHFKKCLRRFNYVSVREKNAVELVKKNFGIVAEHVMDPVFLCKKEHFINLINPYLNDVPKNQIFCYVLEPNKDIEKFLINFSSQKGQNLNIVGDLGYSKETIEKMWDLEVDSIEHNELWLASIYNSSCVIADSFHGLCFALIFEKPFIVVHNERRGDERVLSLLRDIGMEHRIVFPDKDLNRIKNLINEKIDFNTINKMLEEKIKYSRDWFEKHVIN